MRTRLYAAGLAAVMTAGSLGMIAVPAAEARSKSKENAWRIGTYVGGAGTAAALATGHGTWALIGGAATLLSYSQWKKEVRRRHSHQRVSRADYDRYRRWWYSRHHSRHRR